MGRDREPYGSPTRSAWLEVDWSPHRRSFDLPGSRVDAVMYGSGESTVILIHGHDGSWRNWLENIPHLARCHVVVAPDLPGFGTSPLPLSGEVSITGYAATLAALIEQISLSGPLGAGGPAAPVVVVGSSMGGLIAAELAISRPDLVERLVLVSAAGMSDRYMRLPRAVLAHPRAPLRAISRLTAVSRERARFMARRVRLRRAGLGAAVRHPHRIAPEIAAAVIEAGGQPASALAAAAVARHEIGQRLSQVSCPTLIIWGAADAVVEPAAAARFAAQIPGSRLEIFEDTGHLPMLERPERFNLLLDEFVALGAKS